MKKLLWAFSLLTILTSSISLPAFAASGKAIVPPFDTRYYSSTVNYGESFLITNITSSPLTVKISIYSQTGSIITTGLSVLVGNVTNFVLNPGDSSASFTLAANATVHILYSPSTLDCGYATIAWTQDNSSAQYGLIADVKEGLQAGSSYTQRTLAVNNNMPF